MHDRGKARDDHDRTASNPPSGRPILTSVLLAPSRTQPARHACKSPLHPCCTATRPRRRLVGSRRPRRFVACRGPAGRRVGHQGRAVPSSDSDATLRCLQPRLDLAGAARNSISSERRIARGRHRCREAAAAEGRRTGAGRALHGHRGRQQGDARVTRHRAALQAGDDGGGDSSPA